MGDLGNGTHQLNGNGNGLSPSGISDSTSSGAGKSEAERIAALELLVSQQADELLCLKTAYAEMIRRLQEVESRPVSTAPKSSTASHKPVNGSNWSDCCKYISNIHRFSESTQSLNNVGLSRQSPSSQHHTTTPSYQNRRRMSGSARTTALPNKPAPAHTPAAGARHNTGTATPRSTLGSSKRANLSSAENLNTTSSSHAPSSARGTSKKIGAKEVSIERISLRYKVDIGEGLAKMYLKGRAVTMYAPSEQKYGRVNDVGKEPGENLTLQWVFGYRGKDCRNNILVLGSGELCYFAAATAIMYNTETGVQRFYQEHTDDIKSIALHPDKVTVASGQVAGHAEVDGKPHVRVWNSSTLQTMHVLGEGVFGRGVCCLSFSKADGGDLLCAVDESNEHVVTVWEWKSEKKITEHKGSQDPVSVMEWHPARMNSLIMCGKSAVFFWSFSEEKLNKKTGVFEKNEKPKFVTCCAFAENEQVLTGDSNGNIYVWSCDDNKVKEAVENAHDGPIFAMCSVANNCVITGGSKDLTVSLFDVGSLSKVRDLTHLPENIGGIRQLATSGDGGKVFVGTTRNCILEGPFASEEPQAFKSLISSHFDELWGAAVHPTEPKFLTCGMDKLIVLWDTNTRQPIWTKLVEYQLMCASFHPTENVALFGTVEGKWFAMDLDSQEILTLHPDSKEQYDCVAYSPDGSMMAIGSHDNGIYVYRVGENARKYSKMGKCIGHTSFVTHVDWSADSQFLRSNSGDYEVLFWSAATCKQNTDVQTMKDVEWATGTCTLGYNMIGIWPEGADGSDINGCDRSPDLNFVASADDFGKVKLYNYPCYTPKSQCKVGNAHSSHVTRVRFMPDSRTLLSLGGQDCSIMMWKID
ncbi:echinoderm microtubule-associated protein-like 2 isoform X3 [Symsagittifera roscoffensis]